MGFSDRLWAFQQSINGVKYTIGHCEYRYRLNGGHCNQFMAFGISRPFFGPFIIPCHISSKGGVEDADKTYYELHQLHFVAKLRSLYPNIVVDHVANKFTEILEIANASHRCPEYSTTDGFTTRHIVVIHHIENDDEDEKASLEYILREKVDVGREELEEVVYPRLRPATRASIVEILNSPAVLEGECGICLEDIVRCSSNAVRMPCSPSFHRVCLVQWLNTNHSCPMCRYRIPAARYRSDRLQRI